MRKEIKKALTFRASSIGDCLMGKYLLENIHMQFPNARLGIVVGSRGALLRDLFAAYPWLEIIEVNRRHPSSVISLWKDFRGSDLVVTQYSGKAGGRFGLASKFVSRVLAKRGGLMGFTDASLWNDALYDHLLPVRADWAVAEHEREILRAAGLPISIPFPTLTFVRDDAVLAMFQAEAGKYVVAHLFAGGSTRSLQPAKSRELLAALRRALPAETALIVSGTLTERESALAIARGIDAKVIAGEATLQEMMNLISRSSAVVSVDTGIAHIAAQLGVPLLVVRTCLGRNWWLPGQYGKNAPIAVFSRDDLCAAGHGKGSPACINAISIDEVARAVVAPRQGHEGLLR